jgi:plasmid stabilization system protein ParE
MEENREIIWSAQARIDLLESLDFIKMSWNEYIAERFLINVQRKLILLETFPLIGRPVKFPKHCRKVLIKPYHILFYRTVNESIEIIRLFDGRQNPNLLK